MSELLAFEIQFWNTDKEKWDMQAGGHDTFSGIAQSWEYWIVHFPSVHYRLVLIETREIVLDERR